MRVASNPIYLAEHKFHHVHHIWCSIPETELSQKKNENFIKMRISKTRKGRRGGKAGLSSTNNGSREREMKRRRKQASAATTTEVGRGR